MRRRFESCRGRQDAVADQWLALRAERVSEPDAGIPLPKAAPIAEKYREDFAHKTKPLVTQLERLRRTQVAQSDG